MKEQDEADRARWTAVDDYFTELLVGPDPALQAALESSEAAGLPAISVTAPLGKFLMMLAQMRGARNILEIGTLGGYSAIWLGRALPEGGRLITLELDPKNAAIAAANIARAGLSSVVAIRQGPALESLAQLVAEGAGPFDIIFIDADKETYPEYFSWALRLSRAGTVIIADNVVRKGEVVNAGSSDERIQGVRRFTAMLAAEQRVSATAIQTVGAKGYDGFAIATVLY